MDIRPDGSNQAAVVTEHNHSGFGGTDLNLALRRNGIKTIVMTGTATSGCVEFTSRYGYFNDYHVVTVEDCCEDRAQDWQERSMRAMGWRFGLVTSSFGSGGHLGTPLGNGRSIAEGGQD